MQIDCYGFEATSQWFKRRSLKPHLIRENDGVLYISFGYSPHGPIHRNDRDPDGDLRLMWAFGGGGSEELLGDAQESRIH